MRSGTRLVRRFRVPLRRRNLRSFSTARFRGGRRFLVLTFRTARSGAGIRAGSRAGIRARFGTGLITRAGWLLAAPGNQLKNRGSGRSCAVGKNSFRLVRARRGKRTRTTAPGALVPARPRHRGHGIHPTIQQQAPVFLPCLAGRGIRHLMPTRSNRHIKIAPPGVHITRIRSRLIRQLHGERHRRSRTTFIIRHPHPQHIRSAGHRLIKSRRDGSLSFRVFLGARGRKLKGHHRANHNRERGKNPQPMLRFQTGENRSLFPNLPPLTRPGRHRRAAPAGRSRAFPAGALASTRPPGVFPGCALPGITFPRTTLPNFPLPAYVLPRVSLLSAGTLLGWPLLTAARLSGT